MSDEESIAQEPSLPTPGQLLRQAREEKGLSLEQVASKINLRKHNIVAIEGDQDDSNLSTTFTKGYLKLYAKFVGVSEFDILQAYERLNSVTKEPAKLQSFSKRVAKQTSDARLMMVTFFIFAIVIAMAVLWWFQQSKDTPIVQTSSTSPVLPVVEQQNTNTNTVEPISSNQPPIVQRDTVENDGFEQNAINASTIDNTSDSLEGETVIEEDTYLIDDTVDSLGEEQIVDVNQADIGEVDDNEFLSEIADSNEQRARDDSAARVELVFEFSNDCWINLVDATGNNIAFGVKVAGYVMTVDGIPPFEVTLGAPQAVQISMAGEALDISRFPSGRTARFELPLQE